MNETDTQALILKEMLINLRKHWLSTSTDTQKLHFSHGHPLILCDQPNDGGGEVPCYGCLLPLSGASYNCTQCNFSLHKSCAELPNKVIHFLHPKHPLALLPKTPYSGGPPTCDSCDERIWGFGYHCSLCKFDLDIKCVLLQPIVEHEGHEHSFKLLRPTSFTCDACGEISNDISSCVCSTCLLLVHKSCASLQPTIKHVGDERNELGSAFISAPNECTVVLISNDVNEISLTKIDNDVNEVSLTKIERVTKLQHFSHQHSLTLGNDEPEREEICDGCVQTISAPFYKCAQCNFFLHVSCAELPHKIQHLLHPHSLTLFSIRNLDFGPFYCGACYQNFNGFAYGCRICIFFIDVRCTSVAGILRHEAHEHTLSLDQKESESECNACGSRCRTKFRCEACDFNLDLRCAALPYNARHKWDVHPLKLTFHNIEDKSGKYYCDFCEEQRDSNHWFYYCEDCDVAVHPLCLLGKHMMIKFGKSFEIGICPHLVTLVKKH